jgi:hypothetical protein
MAGISLSYCQLIKIVLSQIGGNPLEQLYTSTIQGSRQVAVGLGIPGGLAEIRALIDRITNAINEAGTDVTNAQKLVEAIQQQLFQNPIGFPAYAANSAITSRLTPIISRISVIDQWTANADAVPSFTVTYPYTSASEERAVLASQQGLLYTTSEKLSTFKDYTDRLSGVATLSGAEAAGGCSLQDLLGNGCTPNNSVPDVDLKELITSLKQGDLITAIEQKLLSGSGLIELTTALNDFNTVLTRFNALFNTSINKAALKAAIEAQINHIVYNLLSGCSGGVYEDIMKTDVAAAMTKYVAAKQAQIDGNAIRDSEDGTLIDKPTEAVTVASTTTDSASTQNPDTVEPTTILYDIIVTRPGGQPSPYIPTRANTGAEAARIVEKELIASGAKGSGYKIVVVNPQKNIVVFTLEDRGPLNTGKPNL